MLTSVEVKIGETAINEWVTGNSHAANGETNNTLSIF